MAIAIVSSDRTSASLMCSVILVHFLSPGRIVRVSKHLRRQANPVGHAVAGDIIPK